jgi:hypothetical protein
LALDSKANIGFCLGFALVAPAFASFLTIGVSLESASAEPEKLLATANMIADTMHQIMRIARPGWLSR